MERASSQHEERTLPLRACVCVYLCVFLFPPSLSLCESICSIPPVALFNFEG